jgi:LemA protein
VTTGPMPPSSESRESNEPSDRKFSDRLIPDDLAPEVFERASRYAAAAKDNYKTSDLIEVGAQVDLPPQLIERAIREIEAERVEAAELEQLQRRVRRRLLVGAATSLGLVALGLLIVANGLLRQEERVEAAWAQVENQLQRRAALLPRLSAVAESAVLRDSGLPAQLRQAHAALDHASTLGEKAQASDRVGAVIDRFQRRLASDSAASRDPLLLALQYEITGAENRLAVERMRYNQAVEAYNRSLRTFPGVLPAGWLHLSSRPYFHAEPPGTDPFRPDAPPP